MASVRSEKLWKLRDCREATPNSLNRDCTKVDDSQQGVQNPQAASQVSKLQTPMHLIAVATLG